MEGRAVPVHASGGGVVTHCLFCGAPYALHDHSDDNWLACPHGLFRRLESITWPVQGRAAPSNLLAWLSANNRYPQHRGRDAALKLIAELWWAADAAETPDE